MEEWGKRLLPLLIWGSKGQIDFSEPAGLRTFKCGKRRLTNKKKERAMTTKNYSGSESSCSFLRTGLKKLREISNSELDSRQGVLCIGQNRIWMLAIECA